MRENVISGQFLTTLPEVVGYKTVRSMGVIVESSMMSADKALRDLAKQAEKMGCNAIVNFRLSSGQTYVAYGEAVVVEEKPFGY